MEFTVHKVIECLKKHFKNVEIINYSINMIVINKFGFDSSVIEKIENELDVDLDFYYEFDECDFEIVKIKIK